MDASAARTHATMQSRNPAAADTLAHVLTLLTIQEIATSAGRVDRASWWTTATHLHPPSPTPDHDSKQINAWAGGCDLALHRPAPVRPRRAAPEHRSVRCQGAGRRDGAASVSHAHRSGRESGSERKVPPRRWQSRSRKISPSETTALCEPMHAWIWQRQKRSPPMFALEAEDECMRDPSNEGGGARKRRRSRGRGTAKEKRATLESRPGA
jgi:hypothetical protein